MRLGELSVEVPSAVRSDGKGCLNMGNSCRTEGNSTAQTAWASSSSSSSSTVLPQLMLVQKVTSDVQSQQRCTTQHRQRQMLLQEQGPELLSLAALLCSRPRCLLY
jgi:hypothetical protein